MTALDRIEVEGVSPEPDTWSSDDDSLIPIEKLRMGTLEFPTGVMAFSSPQTIPTEGHGGRVAEKHSMETGLTPPDGWKSPQSLLRSVTRASSPWPFGLPFDSQGRSVEKLVDICTGIMEAGNLEGTSIGSLTIDDTASSYRPQSVAASDADCPKDDGAKSKVEDLDDVLMFDSAQSEVDPGSSPTYPDDSGPKPWMKMTNGNNSFPNLHSPVGFGFGATPYFGSPAVGSRGLEGAGNGVINPPAVSLVPPMGMGPTDLPWPTMMGGVAGFGQIGFPPLGGWMGQTALGTPVQNQSQL